MRDGEALAASWSSRQPQIKPRQPQIKQSAVLRLSRRRSVGNRAPTAAALGGHPQPYLAARMPAR
jgi:hypothetical protein